MPDTAKELRLAQLRTRALQATDALGDDIDGELESALQNLALYQAELEMQHEELVEAEGRVATALAEFTTFFTMLPAAAVVVDGGLRIERCNRMAEALLGLGSQIRRPLSFLSFLDEDSRTMLYPELRDLKVGEVGSAGDLVLTPRRSALEVPVEIHFAGLQPERDVGDPRADRVLMIVSDRRSEKENDRTRRLFQSMLDNSDAQMFAFDAQGRCLLANRAMVEAIGLERHHVLGHTRHSWLSLGEVVDAHNADADVIRSGRPTRSEEVVQMADGLHVTATHRFPLRDSLGRVFAVGGLTTDLTHMRRTELDLQVAAGVLARSAEGVMVTDAAGRIVSVNVALTAMTGYSEEELVGSTPAKLASGRHGAAFFADMWQRLRSDGGWTGEMWNRRKNGELYPQETRILSILDDRGDVINYAALAWDLTDAKASEAEIERLAFYDTLTGLPARRLLTGQLEEDLKLAAVDGTSLAVLHLDLDEFKVVNDAHGHDLGDEVMRAAVARVGNLLRPRDRIGRFGGDECVVVLPDVDEEGAASAAQRIVEAMRQPFYVGGASIPCSVSVGVAMYPQDGTTASDLEGHAERAVQEAKSEGGNGWHFYDAEAFAQHQRRVGVAQRLRTAADAGELETFYQPQVDMATGKVVGAEALVRWHHEELGNPGPAEFIPIAESSGVIHRIGHWVLRDALSQVAQWRDEGCGAVNLAVNVSGRHFAEVDFAATVEAELARVDWPPEALELEITENWALHEPEASAKVMHRLHDAGVRFALDDFGTGYSSLANLRLFPIDTIKIDCSFVWQLGVDEQAEAVVRSIIALAGELGMRCMAEGVETQAQADYLLSRGCALAQGYRYGRPMSAGGFAKWLGRDSLT